MILKGGSPNLLDALGKIPRASRLSDPVHPVAIAMERQKTVPEVQIIEGLP